MQRVHQVQQLDGQGVEAGQGGLLLPLVIGRTSLCQLGGGRLRLLHLGLAVMATARGWLVGVPAATLLSERSGAWADTVVTYTGKSLWFHHWESDQ